MSRCAIWRFHSGRSKVKVTRARRVVPGQPSSLKKGVEVKISLNLRTKDNLKTESSEKAGLF